MYNNYGPRYEDIFHANRKIGLTLGKTFIEFDDNNEILYIPQTTVGPNVYVPYSLVVDAEAFAKQDANQRPLGIAVHRYLRSLEVQINLKSITNASFTISLFQGKMIDTHLNYKVLLNAAQEIEAAVKNVAFVYEKLRQGKQYGQGANMGNPVGGGPMGNTGNPGVGQPVNNVLGSNQSVNGGYGGSPVSNVPGAGVPVNKNAGVNKLVADELFKLKQLLDMGVITQVEFEREKGRLLG